MLRLSDIRIRDPFVFVDKENRTYYLYGTTDENPWEGKGNGFNYYVSKDLQCWSGPYEAFRPGNDFWGQENFWAPEVWKYQDSYIMLASFYNSNMCRGVQVLRTKDLKKPFEPIINRAVTPPQWECLDGTLYIDCDQKPWLVFSHEWTQIGDGAICCSQLSENLEHLCSDPVVLFHASEVSWTVPLENEKNIEGAYVTDGPFLFHDKTGKLKMIWSSFSKKGYAVGCAESISGTILGPWKNESQPFYENDGGHAMIFHSLEEKRYMALHSPNLTPNERPVFIELV